jgi:hypothetical protein
MVNSLTADKRATLLIASGDNELHTLARIFAWREWFELGSDLLLAIAGPALVVRPDAFGSLVRTYLGLHNIAHDVDIASHSLTSAWLSARKTEWRPVTTPAPVDRLDRVWLPRAIVESASLIAINELPLTGSTNDAIAIGIWARFAHPRQRTGARLSSARDGLVPEIALTVRPRLILLHGNVGGRYVIVAADDQIAADLAGRAIQQLQPGLETEPDGPWEDPLIQHATELRLGISHPDQIDGVIMWTGNPTSQLAANHRELSMSMLGRMGVKMTKEFDTAAYT